MKKFYMILILVISISSCKENKSSFDPNTISDLHSFDAGNNQNAGDIYILVQFNSNTKATEARLIIGLDEEMAGFTNDMSGSLTPDRYQSIPINSNEPMHFYLDAGLKTISGNTFVLGQEYTVKIIMVYQDYPKLAEIESYVTLSDQYALNGSYAGTWNDNLYTDFPVSAVLSFDQIANKLIGSFYYTPDFVACCGGSDDGKVEFTINGTTIINYVYNQDLPDFQGGCPGTYSGTGTVNNPVTLEVDFSGDDCEGHHSFGKLELIRSEKN